MRRLQAREPAALRELFDREGRRALGVAYRVLGNSTDAEDAVQQAFEQIWERAARLDPEGGRIESLLMTIVNRRAIDLARARSRQPVSLPPDDQFLEVDEQAEALLDRVLDDLSLAELRTRLRAALDGLPPEQRAVVERAHLQGRTLQEIATEDHVALGTVKSRLRLGMSKLSQALRTRTLP